MIVVKDAPTSLELMRALKILMDMSVWPLVSVRLRACQDAIKSGKWSEAIKQLKQVSNGGKTGAAKEVAKTRLLARGLIDRIKQMPRKPKEVPAFMLKIDPQHDVTNSELVSEINSVIDNYVGQVQKALEILKPMVDRRKKELPIDPQAAARAFMHVANDQPEIAELFNNKWRNAVDTREEKVAYNSAMDRFKKWRAKLGKMYRLLDPYGLIIKYT